MTAAQRLVRLATTVVVRVPGAWRLFRGPLTRTFDRLAPSWEARVSNQGLQAALAAVETLAVAPRRVLDIGTGTGRLARALAGLWPAAQITGADVSVGMIEEARRLDSRVRFDVADAAALPYADGAFDLVALNNMIPFFDEVARVTATSGHVVVAFSMGDRTPIYVPLARVRTELERRGFTHVADFAAGAGASLLAKKQERS
jgi:SAM-dependent methyltransferase